jgi:hypothetical protein
MSTDQFFVRPKLAHFLAIFKCKGRKVAGREQQAAGRDVKLSFLTWSEGATYNSFL